MLSQGTSAIYSALNGNASIHLVAPAAGVSLDRPCANEWTIARRQRGQCPRPRFHFGNPPRCSRWRHGLARLHFPRTLAPRRIRFGIPLVWWLRIGRRQPIKRGRAAMALVYSTALPLLLMGLLPRCLVPRSYALIGLPLAALGCAIAQGRLRLFLATCALVWYLIFAASIPVFHAGSRPAPMQNRHAGCESGGQ